MKQKIYIGLITYFLMFTFCTAVVTDVHAQSKDKDKRSKPTDKAKKLVAEGNKLFNKKDFRTAINKYAEAIVLSPSYAEAHYWKGYAHYYLNEFSESVEALNTSLEQGYNPLEIYKVRWISNFQKQDYDAALSDVENGLLKDKNNTDFITGRSEILVRKGSYKEAVEALQDAIKINPNNGDLYYFAALSYSKTGDLEKQASNAEEAVKKATKYTGESYALMGDSKLASRKTGEAIEAYKKALNVKPEMPEEFFIKLSQSYRAENRLGEAIDTARQGLKPFPRSTPLLTGLTWYYSLADRYNEAVSAGQQAVKNAPDNAAAHTNLCRAYNDVEKFSQAVIECNAALKLASGDGETLFYLARASERLNKPALAADYYKKAVTGLIANASQNPTDPDAFYLLGNAYYKDLQTKKAIEAYKQSIEMIPNFVKAHFNLGNAYIYDENKAAAMQEYNTLLSLDKVYAEKLKKQINAK